MSDLKRPEFNSKYLAARQQGAGVLGYGLGRRTEMLVSAVEKSLPLVGRSQLDVIDFGCADASMLRATAEVLDTRHRSSTGLDVFRSGMPSDTANMRFMNVDLFNQYPYPIADSAYDIAIASAFMKHHPDTGQFLSEVARVLRPGGFAVLLDPRPFAVKLGQLIGKFSRDYNPNPWSRKSVETVIERTRVRLKPVAYERYWVAPNMAIYKTGIERMLPSFLVNTLALHQCLVLKRV